MATTRQIIDAVVARLQDAFPALAVEHFPDRPAKYALDHPVGALLVRYRKSRFRATADVTHIAQPRTVKLSVTVVLRQFNGEGGVTDVLDAARQTLVGFRPPDCRKIWIVSEKCLGEAAGLWRYTVRLATETLLVEDADADTEPHLTLVTYEENP